MKNILEYFEATTKRFPEKIGFTDSERKASFTETMQHAKAIGSALSLYGNRKPVAILIDKSVNCIDAMLGVLYAGDFYIVVDVHSPLDRIENILSVLDDPLIVTDEQREHIAKDLEVEYFLYEKLAATEENPAALDDVRARMCDMDTAYILFTSGSTGMPKGTVISHRALISYINWVTEEFAFDEHTSFGSQTPLYFSMSVTDFYSTVKCGCTYNIIPKNIFRFR